MESSQKKILRWSIIYQSRRTYENFHYYEKGLGYPTASTERIGLSLKSFRSYPALLGVAASYQRIWEIRLTDVFMLEKEKFPVGVAEKSWNLGLDLRYFRDHWSWLTAHVGYERFTNFNHVTGDHRNNFKLVLGAHFNLAFAFDFE